MNIFNRINNAVAAFTKTNNNIGVDPNSYLRYGSTRKMAPKWSSPEIDDRDFYTGYGFAVINKRANRSVVLGKKFLYTDAKDDIIAKANESGERITHPYLDLIRSSVEFSERDFWYDISTYLDLEGVYYLMAVRTVKGGRIGNIQKFSLLNPYKVRPVVNSEGVLGGYVEQRGDKQRNIPKEMIIPIRLLNPFDPELAYSLADAARDSQYTLKQANDFAREAIDGNLNSPGILSSAIELPDDQFDNFVERVKNHGRGEPLFGNGSGTVSWVDMQTDLDKAALDKINSINRDTLLAISGLSKTGVGVEESGTGREVSRTQKDDFTENAIMPQIENIIDALNLDYRKYYETEWRRNGYTILLDNPLETNRDAEQADVDIRDSQFALLQSLLSAGYDYDIAAKYAKGLIDITDLGEAPEKEEADKTPEGDGEDPNEPDNNPNEDDPITENSYKNKTFDVYEGYPVPVLQYLGDNADQIEPISETASFIYSTDPITGVVRINKIQDISNSLIAVVDDSTFIKLGEFKQNADKPAILAKLNKRYTDQPVAIKKKIDLNHQHSVYETIKNAAFDKATSIDENTAQLQQSASEAEERMYLWYLNEIAAGNQNPHVDVDEFINGLALPFAVYFTVMFPIYSQYRLQQTAEQLGISNELPIVAMTQEIKATIDQFAKKEATSHINTIKTDIENAITIIRTKTSNPEEFNTLFAQAFADIQKRRAIAIANNAAARIFNISQYEADLQFLTRAGLVENAYKVLFSLTGDPCSICQHVINQTNAKPIPFTDAFVNMGEEIEAGGIKMKFNFENIIAGNVHPNCNCAYKLIVDDYIANSASGRGAVAVDDSKLPKLARGGYVENTRDIVV